VAFEMLNASVANNCGFSLGYTDKAVTSARAARKKRWICFFIFLLVLIAVGVVVAVEVVNKKK